MAEPELLTEVVEGVGVLRLNRPAAINALTVSMMAGMREALEAWRDDDGVDSVIPRVDPSAENRSPPTRPTGRSGWGKARRVARSRICSRE